MQPIDPTKSPKVQTPALNHIGLWVDHLEKAVESLTAQGVNFTPGGIRKGAGILPFLYVVHTFLDCFPLLFS
jgi:lactoylglutathione lyase